MSKNTKSIAAESLLKDADYNKVSQYDKSHRQIKTLNDPRFGEINILQNPSTRQVVAVREKKVTDKAEAGRLILQARNRMALNNPALVNLLDYSVTKQSELCSSFYIIKYYFEYPRTDLRKLTTDREKNGQGLTSAELTNIFYQQNQAQAYLQSNGMAHGDLQPLYIGYDPERMESKLIDKSESLSNDAAIITAQKNRLISGQPLYMSPTMYSNLKKGNTKFQFDRNKEDAFALGLMLLEAGNGRSVQNIYDTKTGQVNNSILNQHLEEFNRKFGGQNTLLVSHVSSMTNTNEAARPSPLQIQASLPPYEEIKGRLLAEGSTNTSSGFIQGQSGYGATGQSSYGQASIYGQGGQVGAFPIGVDQSTRSIVQGGDSKTVVTIKKDMPVVEEDLFAFDRIEVPVSAQSQVQWDPSYVAPKTIEVPSARYQFTPDPSKSQVGSQSQSQIQTQTAYSFQPASQPGLFEETTTSGENLFSTFGGAKPAHATRAAKVDTALIYGGDQYSGADSSNNYNNQFGNANFNRKVYGERAVGSDPNADFNSQANTSQAQNQAAPAQNFASQNYGSQSQAQAPAQNYNAQAQAAPAQNYGSQAQAQNYSSQAQAPAQAQSQAAAPAPVQAPAPAQAPTVTTTTTTTEYIYGNSNLNRSAGGASDIIPTSMRKSVSSQSHSNLQHTFRLYDSTVTEPEVIQGQSYTSPIHTSYSTNTSASIRPSSGYATFGRPTDSHTTTIINEAPVRSSYVVQAPTTTYQTYSQSTVPATQSISYAAPSSQSISYAAPATQTISYAAPTTQTVTYAAPASQSISYAAPIRQSVVYTQPQIVETPVQTYQIVESPAQAYQIIDNGDAGIRNLGNSQVISSTYVSSNPELQGLKLVGTYTDDKYATYKAGY